MPTTLEQKPYAAWLQAHFTRLPSVADSRRQVRDCAQVNDRAGMKAFVSDRTSGLLPIVKHCLGARGFFMLVVVGCQELELCGIVIWRLCGDGRFGLSSGIERDQWPGWGSSF